MRLVRLAQQPARVSDDIRAALASLGRGSTVIGGIALIGVTPPGCPRPVDAIVLLPRGLLIVIGVDLPDPAMHLEAPLEGRWRADGWALVRSDDSVNPATEALALSESIASRLRELHPDCPPIGTIVAVGPFVDNVDQPPADLAGPVRVLYPTPTSMLAATISLASAARPGTVAQVGALLATLAPDLPEQPESVLIGEGFSLAEPTPAAVPTEHTASAVPTVPTVPAKQAGALATSAPAPAIPRQAVAPAARAPLAPVLPAETHAPETFASGPSAPSAPPAGPPAPSTPAPGEPAAAEPPSPPASPPPPPGPVWTEPERVRTADRARWLPFAAIALLVLLLAIAITVAASGSGGPAPAPVPGDNTGTAAAPSGDGSAVPGTTASAAPTTGVRFGSLASAADQRCASHAYGGAQASLQGTSCRTVRRASLDADVGGRHAAVSVGVVTFADAAQANAFSAVLDGAGGGINDLATETRRWPGQAPSFDGAATADQIEGDAVRLVRVAWLDGPSTSDDPGLAAVARAALQLPLSG